MFTTVRINPLVLTSVEEDDMWGLLPFFLFVCTCTTVYHHFVHELPITYVEHLPSHMLTGHNHYHVSGITITNGSLQFNKDSSTGERYLRETKMTSSSE